MWSSLAIEFNVLAVKLAKWRQQILFFLLVFKMFQYAVMFVSHNNQYFEDNIKVFMCLARRASVIAGVILDIT